MVAVAALQSITHTHDWLWQQPSLFSVANLGITLSLFVYVVWRFRALHGASEVAVVDVNPRDYHKLAKRLDGFEESQGAMIERLAEQGVAAGTRHEERISALHSLVDVSTKQYEAGENQANAIKKLLAQNAWIVRTLAERPCVMNERENGDAECPEGHGPASPSASPSAELMTDEY